MWEHMQSHDLFIMTEFIKIYDWQSHLQRQMTETVPGDTRRHAPQPDSYYRPHSGRYSCLDQVKGEWWPLCDAVMSLETTVVTVLPSDENREHVEQTVALFVLCIGREACLCTCPTVCPSVFVSICVAVCLSFYLFIYISLSVRLFSYVRLDGEQPRYSSCTKTHKVARKGKRQVWWNLELILRCSLLWYSQERQRERDRGYDSRSTAHLRYSEEVVQTVKQHL